MTDVILRVGFSFSKPPFVLADPPFTDGDYDVEGGGLGLEIDFFRSVLGSLGLSFRPVYLDYDALNPELAAGNIDAAATVRPELDDAFYTGVFVSFHNFAITRSGAAQPIDRVEDLAGRNIVAWEGAHFDLGESFAAAVELAASYRELGNQHGQVQDFLDESSDVLVIDGLVFRHWARASGFDPGAFELHDIFEPVTTFRAGFRSETLRDDFEAGLKELLTSGEYELVVGSYVG